ncbi:glycoside hydrolase family 13 protein [Rubrivirga sp.]|uniref:glycoside hydrolase family 13 protein n=1 Tax=Rubrivirga sp. TaxID=1885344 RepID=UPI003B515585
MTARLLALAALAASAVAAQPAPPAWAQDAVWYQVFPERFSNGDPANDPTRASLENSDAVGDDWAVTPWTADWYARAPWEEARGPDFYDDGVFDRRLGGDLQGVLDRVPYLDSLGVTAVYLNPVFWAASLHKYDATSYHHVDPFFGPDPQGDIAMVAGETADPATWVWTSADRLFLDLVAAFHARGIRVVIDGVFNHTGTRFWAFQDVRRNQQASRYADWYEVTAWDDPATPESEFDWNGWWGYKPLAVLANTADGADLHPGVKAHVFDATRRWMDPDGDGNPADGVDGWRLDVAGEVPDGFWRDWTALVAEVNPNAITIAEEWGDAPGTLARTGFHSTMNYHALAIPLDAFAFDGRTDAATFAREVTERFEAFPDATRPALMNVLAGHDTDRLASMIVNGRLGGGYDRLAGPRDTTAYLVRAPRKNERDLQRAVVLLQMALPGAPHVYYGDEAGMWGADDPDDRKPMVWPDLTYEPEASAPRGLAREPDPVAFDRDLFAFTRGAIALRQSDAVLRRGSLATVAAHERAVAFERVLDGDRRVVAFNPGGTSAFVPIPSDGVPAPLVPMMVSRDDAGRIAGLVVQLDEETATYGLRIPPRTTVVFRPADPADVRPRGLDE